VHWVGLVDPHFMLSIMAEATSIEGQQKETTYKEGGREY
jgi:hypothetical protein